GWRRRGARWPGRAAGAWTRTGRGRRRVPGRPAVPTWRWSWWPRRRDRSRRGTWSLPLVDGRWRAGRLAADQLGRQRDPALRRVGRRVDQQLAGDPALLPSGLPDGGQPRVRGTRDVVEPDDGDVATGGELPGVQRGERAEREHVG